MPIPRYKLVLFAIAVHGRMNEAEVVHYLVTVLGDADLPNGANGGTNMANQNMAAPLMLYMMDPKGSSL